MYLLLNEDELNIVLKELQEIKKILQSSQKKLAQKEYVNTDEAAKLLKVTTRTLQNWRDQRLISFIQIGSKILFKKADVEDFLMRHYIKRKEG